MYHVISYSEYLGRAEYPVLSTTLFQALTLAYRIVELRKKWLGIHKMEIIRYKQVVARFST